MQQLCSLYMGGILTCKQVYQDKGIPMVNISYVDA